MMKRITVSINQSTYEKLLAHINEHYTSHRVVSVLVDKALREYLNKYIKEVKWKT